MILSKILKNEDYLILIQLNQRRHRGMSTYYDIIDWLGGLPYEVASTEEIIINSKSWFF